MAAGIFCKIRAKNTPQKWRFLRGKFAQPAFSLYLRIVNQEEQLSRIWDSLIRARASLIRNCISLIRSWLS